MIAKTWSTWEGFRNARCELLKTPPKLTRFSAITAENVDRTPLSL